MLAKSSTTSCEYHSIELIKTLIDRKQNRKKYFIFLVYCSFKAFSTSLDLFSCLSFMERAPSIGA